MKVLILNGSPRGKQSNTMAITDAFARGLAQGGDHAITSVEVRSKRIEHCLGCFACWKDTPGVCVIDDDMGDILPKLIEADLVVWSFPLYYYSLPSKIKALMDRTLPLNLPFMDAREEGGATHPSRYDMSGQRAVVISSCGFYSTEHNYEAVAKQFEIMYGEDRVTAILCAEGELLRIPELHERVGEYLSAAERAGREYAQDLAVSDTTKAELEELLLPEDTYARLADASWGIDRGDHGQSGAMATAETAGGSAGDPSYAFVSQMAALYNPLALSGKEAILDLAFTDIGITHRLFLDADSCRICREPESSRVGPAGVPVTRVETPFPVWSDISKGKLDGAKAMMDGLYRVTGNFDLMLKMDSLFNGKGVRPKAARDSVSRVEGKRENMALLILPWLSLWILLPLSPNIAGYAGALSAAAVHFASCKWELGAHERVSSLLITLISLASFSSVSPATLIPLSYLAFGAHWLITAFSRVPLTAVYSRHGYGGDGAYGNALFMRTNRIITVVWGALYLATACWTVPLLETPVAPYVGGINSIVPALAGAWTAWFQGWYPARVAGGK